MRRKIVALGLGVLIGCVCLAGALLWGLSSPAMADACVPGFDRCVSAAAAIGDRIDCRVEMFHCRLHGVEHWDAGH